MQINLTGNPFVDTGLFVIAYHAHKENPNELTLEDLIKVHENGMKLAQINSRLKSFTMVFGTNGPLTQSGYRPVGKKKLLSEKNITAYTNVLNAFLEASRHENTDLPLCEICGCNHTFDFSAIVRKALIEADIVDPGEKQIGRDWFPLSGSPGNDAQTLPSASRGLSICPICLFVVHYVPQALMLMQGKLVCFQSNISKVAAGLTESIVVQYQSELDATTSKIEMIGKKEGTAAMTKRLLLWMKRRQEVSEDLALGHAITLQVWLFTNAGADANCEIVDIPNNFLQFLWLIRKLGLTDELMQLLKQDPNIADLQFLNCVCENRDYENLYPTKSTSGVSPKFFALYQQYVLNVSQAALQCAQKFAVERLKTASPKECKFLQKAGFLNGINGKEERRRFRKVMLEMGKNSMIRLDEYAQLFPTTQHHPIQTDFRGWKTISYYLSNPDAEIRNFFIPTTANMKHTHPKITILSKLYFDDYLFRRGIDHFEKHILDNFSKSHSNPINWLKDMFIRFAKHHPNFCYEDWDEFVLDDSGVPQISELVFQMRLELANLFREYTQTKQEKK